MRIWRHLLKTDRGSFVDEYQSTGNAVVENRWRWLCRKLYKTRSAIVARWPQLFGPLPLITRSRGVRPCAGPQPPNAAKRASTAPRPPDWPTTPFTPSSSCVCRPICVFECVFVFAKGAEDDPVVATRTGEVTFPQGSVPVFGYFG